MKTDVVTKLRAGASLRTQKTAAAEIERLRALVPAWRDIASAPRDNQTVFLAFCPPKRRNKKIRPGDEHLYIQMRLRRHQRLLVRAGLVRFAQADALDADAGPAVMSRPLETGAAPPLHLARPPRAKRAPCDRVEAGVAGDRGRLA
ncbi:MAG TPA: hypothetical protein PLB34_07560, partial [Rhodoblastus sp.]|nr:hypothetical protein [Rhodoblastus sp.]